MIKCGSCGTENLDGSQFCDECGASLTGNGAIPAYQPPMAEPSFNMASVTSIGIEPIADVQVNNAVAANVPVKSSRAHASLVIERGVSVGREFELLAEEFYIGRWDADNGVFPDVDLDAHDPEAKVSRRHARIILRDGKYTIEDLGSTNGTFLNRGRRLIPGALNILDDGDEIIVGKTFLRFRVNS